MNSLIKRQENTTTTSPPADEIVEEVVNEEVIEEELPEVEPPVTPEVPVEPPIPAGPTQEELDKIAADKKADKEAQDLLDQEAAEEKARLAAEKKAAVEKAAAQKAAEEEADSKKANDDKAAADLAETNRLADERAASLEQQRQQQQIQKQASTRHFNSLNRLQAVNTETVQVEEVEEETVTEEEAETEDVVDSGFDVPPVEVFVDSGAVSVPVVAQKPFTDGVTSIGGSASDGDSSNGLGIGAIGGVIAVALVAVLSIGFFVVKRRRGTNKERVASMNPFLSSSPEIIIDAPSESKRGMHDMLFTAPAATVVQMPPLTSSPVSTYSPILQAQDGSFFGDAAPSMHDSIVLGNQPWFGSVTTDTTSEMSSEDGWSGGELNDAIDASGDRGSLYNSIYSAKTMDISIEEITDEEDAIVLDGSHEMRRSSNFGFEDEVESIALNDAPPITSKTLPSVPFAMQYAKKNQKPKSLRVSQISAKRSSQTHSPLRESFRMESEESDSDEEMIEESMFEESDVGRDSWMSSMSEDSDAVSRFQSGMGSQL